MCGGGKQNRSTQTSGYTSNAAGDLQGLISRATDVSNTAYNPATQQQVAGFDPQQMQAFQATGAQQGAWQPFVNQAQQFAQQGASGIAPGQIQAYQNPYENQVVANLQNDFNTQNQRELQNVTGNAAARGALGNSNVEVAKSLAMERARSGQDAQIANVRQQGFNTALGAAQGDRSAAQFGAGAMGALGNQAQQAGYTDIGALLASGGMQQGLQQRQFDTASGNAQAESAYPFQTTQWLASLLNPTASTMGGSTSGVSTTPGASPWNSILGGLSSAAGAWMLSDEDAKHDIKQVGQTNDGMPIYTFKYDGSDQTQMGLLAQDVEQRDPGAVAEFGGMKHVNYDRATENSMPEFAQGGEVDPDMRRLTSGLQHAVTGMMAARKAGGGEVGMVPYANAKSYVPVREVIGGKPDMPKMQAPQSQESGGGNLNSIGSALGKWMGRPSAPTTGWDATVTPEMASGGEVEAEWGSEVFKPFTSRLSDELQESEAGRLPMFATSAQPMMQAWRQGVDEDLDAKGLPANDPVMVADAMPAFSPAPARSQEYAGEKKVINDGWTPAVTQEMPQTEAAKKAWYESGSNPALGRALMQAGFAMMASKSPHAGQAIGEGGLAGVGDYVAQQREGLEKRKAELQEQHRRDQVAQQQAQLAHQKDVLGETRRFHDNTAGMQQKQFERQMVPEMVRQLEAAGYVRGTPEFNAAATKMLGHKQTDLVQQAEERKQVAERLGMKPEDPAYKSFIATGRMPREDQAPLTATDKKAILEADEQVNSNKAVLRSLDDADRLNKQANQGMFASGRATLGNYLPDLAVPDAVSSPRSSEATANYENVVIGQALQQLKTTFGAAPTEGERKILLDLQGSVNMPTKVRAEILKRARIAADARLKFNEHRAAELRGGSYYKPNAGASAQPSPQTPQVGEVVDGYRFKGGSPADKSNWEKVN